MSPHTVKVIRCGRNFNTAIDSVGGLWTWGWNARGALGRSGFGGIGPGLVEGTLEGQICTAIIPGARHSVVITEPRGVPFARQFAYLREAGRNDYDLCLYCTESSASATKQKPKVAPRTVKLKKSTANPKFANLKALLEKRLVGKFGTVSEEIEREDNENIGSSNGKKYCNLKKNRHLAHRMIVSARCPALFRMICCANEEGVTGQDESGRTILQLPCDKPRVLRALLDYLYTDYVNIPSHYLNHLQSLACHLGLKTLVTRCNHLMTRYRRSNTIVLSHSNASTQPRDTHTVRNYGTVTGIKQERRTIHATDQVEATQFACSSKIDKNHTAVAAINLEKQAGLQEIRKTHDFGAALDDVKIESQRFHGVMTSTFRKDMLYALENQQQYADVVFHVSLSNDMGISTSPKIASSTGPTSTSTAKKNCPHTIMAHACMLVRYAFFRGLLSSGEFFKESIGKDTEGRQHITLNVRKFRSFTITSRVSNSSLANIILGGSHNIPNPFVLDVHRRSHDCQRD